jgi:hypothetical protein
MCIIITTLARPTLPHKPIKSNAQNKRPIVQVEGIIIQSSDSVYYKGVFVEKRGD